MQNVLSDIELVKPPSFAESAQPLVDLHKTILLPVKAVPDNRSGTKECFAGPNEFLPPLFRRSGTWLQHCGLLTQHTPWTNYLDLYFILMWLSFYMYIDPFNLANNMAYNHQTLHETSTQPSDPVTMNYISRYSDFVNFLHQPFQCHKLYGLRPPNLAWDIYMYLTWTTCTLTKWPWAIFHTPVAVFLRQPSRSR